MIKIKNLTVEPYITLPGGITITIGESTELLNKNILDTPEMKEAIENESIEIITDKSE